MENLFNYVVSQILASLAIALTVFAYQQKKKKQILSFTIAATALYTTHYFLLGAWSGGIINIVNIVRDYYVRRNNPSTKKIWPLIVFISLYIVMTIVSFSSWLSFLPLCAAIIYSTGVYFCNEQRLRIVTIICCLIWFTYNLSIFSVIGIISDLLVASSNIIAYLRFNKKTGRKTSHGQSSN